MEEELDPETQLKILKLLPFVEKLKKVAFHQGQIEEIKHILESIELWGSLKGKHDQLTGILLGMKLALQDKLKSLESNH